MGDLQRQFLEDLHECGVRKVEPRLLRETIYELDSHLTAAIQARMELGTPPDLAEIESVRAMGAPKVIVNRLIEVDRTPPKVSGAAYLIFSCLVTACIGVLTVLSLGPSAEWGFACLYALFKLSLACLVVVGWVYRRPKVRAVWLSFCLACVVYTACIGIGFTRHPEFVPAVDDSRYGELQAQYLDARNATQGIRAFEDSSRRYRSGEWQVVTTSFASGALSTRSFASKEQGLRYIERYERESMPNLRKRAANLAASEAALHADPSELMVLTWLESIKLGFRLGIVLSLFSFGLHLLGVVLRFLYEQARRRRRFRAVA